MTDVFVLALNGVVTLTFDRLTSKPVHELGYSYSWHGSPSNEFCAFCHSRE